MAAINENMPLYIATLGMIAQ
ncbi:hypothetical protein XFF6990_140308 [Xanthomonas citri pv. fuscans]|nr:hypothetical protein XFF6990_140308 [Xanthomonas citri pv. fuscans]